LAGKATFSKEVISPKNGDYRFLALFGYNGELDLTGLNID